MLLVKLGYLGSEKISLGSKSDFQAVHEVKFRYLGSEIFTRKISLTLRAEVGVRPRSWIAAARLLGVVICRRILA